MRHRDFAGPRAGPAPDHGGHAGGMVRRAERAPIGQRPALQRPGDRRNHRDFQKLRRRERRQQRGQAHGEHRLARPGRAGEQKIVTAGGGDLQGALGALLPLHIGKVRQRAARSLKPRPRTLQKLAPGEVIDELNERGGREHRHVRARPGSFRAAFLRADQTMAARIGADGGRQHAGNRGEPPVQRQFPNDGKAFEAVGTDGADRRHQPQSDRQVVMAALLGQVGRGEIDGDALGRQGEAGGDQRGAHPLLGLGHRLVGQPDQIERRQAGAHLHLHVDRAGLHPLERHRRHALDHAALPPADLLWIPAV